MTRRRVPKEGQQLVGESQSLIVSDVQISGSKETKKMIKSFLIKKNKVKCKFNKYFKSKKRIRYKKLKVKILLQNVNLIKKFGSNVS